MVDSGVYSQLGAACVRLYLSPWVWIFHAQRRCSSLVTVDWGAHVAVVELSKTDRILNEMALNRK